VIPFEKSGSLRNRSKHEKSFRALIVITPVAIDGMRALCYKMRMELDSDIQAICEMPKSRTVGSFYNLLAWTVRKRYPEVSKPMSKRTPKGIESIVYFMLDVAEFFLDFTRINGDPEGGKLDFINSECIHEFRRFLFHYKYTNPSQKEIAEILFSLANEVENDYELSFAQVKIQYPDSMSASLEPQINLFIGGIDRVPDMDRSQVGTFSDKRLSAEEVTALSAEHFFDVLSNELRGYLLLFNTDFIDAQHFVYFMWQDKTGKWGEGMTAVFAAYWFYYYFATRVAESKFKRDVLLAVDNYCWWHRINLPDRSYGTEDV